MVRLRSGNSLSLSLVRRCPEMSLRFPAEPLKVCIGPVRIIDLTLIAPLVIQITLQPATRIDAHGENRREPFSAED
jgi:hypothetical protein